MIAFLRQLLTTLPILLLSFMYGCKVGYTQSATPIFNSTEAPFKVTESDISWMGSISYTGTLISVVLCLLIGNKFGRKKFILASVLAYVLIWVLFLTTSSSLIVILGLMVYGMSASMHVVIGSIYFGEVASPVNREIFGIVYSLSMQVGIGIEFLISLFDNYRVLIIFPVAVGGVTLLVTLFMKESPYYSLSKNDTQKALRDIAWLNYSAEEQSQQELENMMKYVREQEKSKGSFSAMFERKNLKLLGLMVFLNGSILINSGTVAQQYGQVVMQDFAQFLNLRVFVNLFNLISFIGAITSLITVKFIGRQYLLQFGFLLMVVSQLLVAVAYFIEKMNDNKLEKVSWVIAGLHCGSFFINQASVTAGLSVLKTEIFPHKLKEFYSSLLAFTSDAIGFAIVKSYSFLAGMIGVHFVVAFYALINFFSFTLVLFFVRDTKNKSLYEIRNDYGAFEKKKKIKS